MKFRTIHAFYGVYFAIIGTTVGVEVASTDPPLMATPIPSTATIVPTQVPTVVSTSTPTPTATVTPTPTPTLDPVIEISAGWKIERSLLYLPSIIQLNEYELDPLLVISVIAAESGGDYTVVSYAGACGPMQVIPKPWYQFSASAICESSWANMIMGMRILRGAIDNADGDVRLGLAYYNCSEESVHADLCGDHGGLNYAENVLEFWYPMIVAQMEE